MNGAADRWRVARIAFAVACAAWWLQKLGWLHPTGQWDFRVYYFGAQAWRSGLDPYDPRVLPADLLDTGFKFNYPPYTLPIFAAFTYVPIVRAMQLFLALKLAALGGVLAIWNRLLGTRLTEPAWVLFLVFAYSSAIFVDFVSGSVTTFEQLLIWVGVAALIESRDAVFAAAIVAASLLRLTPIALLVAGLAAAGRRGVRSVAVGFAAFAAIFAITSAVAPQLMAGFVRSLPTNWGERGWLNPAALPLAIDVAATFGRALHVALPPAAPAALYAAMVIAIGVQTVIALARFGRAGGGDRPKVVVYVAFLAIALVLPRFKNYSYMLLIAPTYFVATRSTQLRRAVPLLVIACLPIYSWITTPEHLALVADYSKWLIAFAAWALFLYEMHLGTWSAPPVAERVS